MRAITDSKEEDTEHYITQRVEHQEGTYQSYCKTAHNFTKRVMLQNDTCRAQYTRNENERTQPPNGVISE